VVTDIRREFGAPGIAVAVRALRTIGKIRYGKFAMEVLIRKVGVSPLAVPTCRAPRLTLETHFLLCLS
jgi:small neutral amino acid transporter SnatA (MarC family)